ncbi:MAG: alanine--tRNA ligase, partial [Candidatus Cloacimonetes bacterium]|nr:alanine--tRNA ligase [Candidatus Cloacimonadota bacterium]
TREHQEKSRAGARQKFAGGLADHSEETAKLHTATHLLHAALRQVLGGHVQQKGSNITEERLRFDFSHDKPLSELEIKRISELVNQKIAEDLPITMEIMTLDKAKTAGALAFFGEKYGEKVKVYSIGDFSREVCGGPHTKRTGELGHFKIIKQESVGKGVRRVKGVIE